MDRLELLERIRNGRAELEAALAYFDKSNLTEPLLANGRSVKDLIAHIGFWERRMVNLYGTLADGKAPEDTIDGETLDDLNERIFKDNLLVPLGIVKINEIEAFAALLDIAETAPEADLFDPQRFAWTEGEAFFNWIVENTYGHYADHIPELMEVAGRI
jgi:hypothetical protein